MWSEDSPRYAPGRGRRRNRGRLWRFEVFPRADHHAQAVVRKDVDGFVRVVFFVMPVAAENVLRNQVDGLFRSVGGGLVPARIAGAFSAEQAVGPEHRFDAARCEVAGQHVDVVCEKDVRRRPAAALAHADQERLVAADVYAVRLEGVGQLVRQIKQNRRQQRMRRA